MELNKEQITQIINRLKECENGYDGTLFLDRCKLHDAEQNVKQLTEENERLKKDVADLQDELKCEKETNAHLCSQYMSENHLRHQVEEMLANGMSVVKADTVRKMQERLKERKVSYGNITFKVVPIDDIDQIAKEMVEGSECG